MDDDVVESMFVELRLDIAGGIIGSGGELLAVDVLPILLTLLIAVSGTLATCCCCCCCCCSGSGCCRSSSSPGSGDSGSNGAVQEEVHVT